MKSKWVYAIIAAIYAIPVSFAVWLNFPTERQIHAATARNAIAAVQQSDEKYKNMAREGVRRRLYRGLTDEQVIVRVRELAAAEEHRVSAQAAPASDSGGEAVTGLYTSSFSAFGQQPPGVAELMPVTPRPKLAVLMEEVDKQHADGMATLKTRQLKVVAWGIAAWLLPVLALFTLAPRLSFSRKRVRRL